MHLPFYKDFCCEVWIDPLIHVFILSIFVVDRDNLFCFNLLPNAKDYPSV